MYSLAAVIKKSQIGDHTNNNRGGGVAIYLRESLHYIRLQSEPVELLG